MTMKKSGKRLRNHHRCIFRLKQRHLYLVLRQETDSYILWKVHGFVKMVLYFQRRVYFHIYHQKVTEQ